MTTCDFPLDRQSLQFWGNFEPTFDFLINSAVILSYFYTLITNGGAGGFSVLPGMEQTHSGLAHELANGVRNSMCKQHQCINTQGSLKQEQIEPSHTKMSKDIWRTFEQRHPLCAWCCQADTHKRSNVSSQHINIKQMQSTVTLAHLLCYTTTQIHNHESGNTESKSFTFSHWLSHTSDHFNLIWYMKDRLCMYWSFLLYMRRTESKNITINFQNLLFVICV